MTVRILIAGVLGGLAMFVWASIAHILTPLGSTGFSQIPNEAAVLSSMQGAIGSRPGLYFFPGMDPNAKGKGAAMKAYQAKAESGPSGLLLYRPAEANAGMSPKQLGGEFLFEVIEALIAAWLLSRTAMTRYLHRVAFVAAIGVAAALTTNASYWVWYGFPTDYTLAYAFTDFMRYVFAGAVIAAIVKPRVIHAGAL